MQIGEPGVCRRPHSAAVRGAEDAVTIGPCVQSGGGEGVNGKGPDPRIGESGIHCGPSGAAVRGAEDATTTSTGIQGVRGERLDGKTQKSAFVQRQLCPGPGICCPCGGGTSQYTRKTQNKAQNQRQDKTYGLFHSTGLLQALAFAHNIIIPTRLTMVKRSAHRVNGLGSYHGAVASCEWSTSGSHITRDHLRLILPLDET
jgi:hypothetical protein